MAFVFLVVAAIAIGFMFLAASACERELQRSEQEEKPQHRKAA
jgi:hypothetical protein